MPMLPAGEYYIGDPCYVIDNDKWGEFLDPFWDKKPKGGVFDFDGYQCAAFYTKYGDGCYTLEPGYYRIPVDAGMIGAIPMALVVQGGEEDGAFVTFDKPFQCQEWDGQIRFGHYTVETGDEMDEDEDEYE